MTDTQQEDDGQNDTLPDTSGEDWTTITDVKVVQSRITIPQRPRDRHGFGDRGDILDVVVHPPEGEPVYVKEARVGGQHRLLLPIHRVRMNGLEGEHVDIEVRDTGLVYGGGA